MDGNRVRLAREGDRTVKRTAEEDRKTLLAALRVWWKARVDVDTVPKWQRLVDAEAGLIAAIDAVEGRR